METITDMLEQHRNRGYWRHVVVLAWEIWAKHPTDVAQDGLLGEVEADSRDAAKVAAVKRCGGQVERYGAKYLCHRYLPADQFGNPIRAKKGAR